MTSDFNREVHCILGLPFDAVDLAGAVSHVSLAARERRSCFLSTPNLNFLIGCRQDAAFRESVVSSDLSVVDGKPLVWIARLLGIPIRERVAGSGLFEELRRGNSAPLSVYFFGGGEGVAERACLQLAASSSGLKCVGFESPGFGSIEDLSSEATMAKINASGADILLVSLTARKGQAWLQHNRGRIQVPVVSCLGATLNFVAGTVTRAPAWMQRAGLEWLWRIKEEPALWRRYFNDGWALVRLIATRVLPYAWFQLRNGPDAGELSAAGADTRDEGSQTVIRVKGAWNRENLSVLRECFSRAVLSGKDIALELAEVTHVDSAFVGLVMLLQSHQAGISRRLRIVSPSEPLRRVIGYCCAEFLLPDSGHLAHPAHPAHPA